MLFFFRSIIIQVFLNAYIIYRIGKSNYLTKIRKRIFIAVYIAEILVYFTGLLFTNRLPVETVGIIERICGVWAILQIYLLGLIWLFDLLYFLIKRYFDRFYRFNEKRIRKIKVISFVCICILIGVGLAHGYYNFTNPVVKNQSFVFNSSNGIKTYHSSPIACHSYKMLVASDFHLGYIVDAQMLKKYVNLINEQRPDIVVIAGDLIDWDLRPLIESKMQEELKKIQAPKGVYFVPGNHEYKLDADAALNWIAQGGMDILKDSIVSIDDKLWLIGRDDEKNDNRKSMADLMKNFDTSKPCIMLTHRPSNIKEATVHNIPLTLCGHTHCGQIFPVNLFAGLFYSNPHEWKEIDNCHSYTTSGLGLSGFPLRLGSRCEAVVFDIRIY